MPLDTTISRERLLTALPVMLFVGGLLAFFLGQLLVAGVCFLGLSLSIYLREKRL